MPILSKVLGFASIRWAWIAGSAALFASMYAVTSHYESKGYNKAVIEFKSRSNEEIQKATKKAFSEAAKKMQEALNRQRNLHEMEIKRVSDERKVIVETEKVIEYVDKIQFKDNCSTASDDVTKLLNRSVTNSNSASSRVTGDGS